MPVDDRALTERAVRIEALLGDIELFPDAALRAKAAEVVQDLLVLYGEGLARMLAIVRGQVDRATAVRMLDAFAADELVSHLLLLHDLHPVDVETRVARALDEVRPYLQSHGGDVELLGVDGGVARLRLQGSCHGCPSSTVTLKSAIEDAVQKAAPDLDGIEAEGVAAPASSALASGPGLGPTGFVPVSTLTRRTSNQANAHATRPATEVAWQTTATEVAPHAVSEALQCPFPAMRLQSQANG